MELISSQNDRFDPALHLEDIPSYWGNLRDPDLMKPHIDSTIADAEANGYYTYIIQCQGAIHKSKNFKNNFN